MIPPITVIESTNACNLKCLMCARNYMTRPVGFMDLELEQKIVSQIPSGRFIWTHGWGEPLLHPQFDEFVKIAKGQGLQVGAITNATLLTVEWAKKIFDSKLDWLVFSIDAESEILYQKIRGVSYQEVASNVSGFLDLKRKLGYNLPHTQINIVDIPLSQEEISPLIRRWRRRVDKIRIKHMNDYGSQCPKIHALKKEPLRPRRAVCSAVVNGGIIIYWDGRVGPCCTDFDGKIIYGDLNKQTIEEVWGGPVRRNLLEDQKKGIFHEECKYCRIHEDPFRDVA